MKLDLIIMFINHRTISTILACCSSSRIVSNAAKNKKVCIKKTNEKLSMLSEKEEKLQPFKLLPITKWYLSWIWFFCNFERKNIFWQFKPNQGFLSLSHNVSFTSKRRKVSNESRINITHCNFGENFMENVTSIIMVVTYYEYISVK